MYKAQLYPYQFQFITPGGTSRGVLTSRPGWIIELYHTSNPQVRGFGECCIIPGLSFDDRADLPQKIEEVVIHINEYIANFHESLQNWPSVRFALETALLDLEREGKHIIFPSAFSTGLEGININGLIWMGQPDYMRSQIERKLKEGYRCLKMKIGAIGFDQELAILKDIRHQFSADVLELRVDANGAFNKVNVGDKLDALYQLHIHSIEQPIRQGQWAEMANVCQNSPIDIALDEELIGITNYGEMRQLLETIRPAYIILKPGLLGGFQVCRQWIQLAEQLNIGWWITSALESNIGLNAIAQWTFTLNNAMPQGLGTGQVFSNNIPSPLCIRNGKLFYNPEQSWDFSVLNR